MALVLEDGTGVTGANSYVDQTYADAYFTDRGGNATWTALSSDQKDQSLIKATDYVEKRFGHLFLSEKDRHTNPLSWPRRPVYDDLGRVRFDSNDIPAELKKAVSEYAVRASAANLITDPTAGLEVAEEIKKVGPLEKRTRYAHNGNSRQKSGMVKDSAVPEYPNADMWIESLLRPSSVRQLARV